MFSSSAQAKIPHAPEYIQPGHSYIIGPNYVSFFYARCDPARSGGTHMVASKCIKTNKCHRKDRQYWLKLPNIDVAEKTRLILGWHCVSGPQRGSSGWMEVYGVTGSWRFKTSGGNAGSIPNGKDTRQKWTLDGYPIIIRVYNPLNNNGWTNRDIIYEFK